MYAADEKTKLVWLEKLQSAIDALVLSSPSLKDMRSEIKIPQVSAFYKHFTIPIEDILAEADTEVRHHESNLTKEKN